MNSPIPPNWSGRLMSMLRIVAGVLIIMHGTQKLFAWPTLEPRQAVALGSLFGVASVLEIVGGTLVTLGLYTRPVAFILAGEMAYAFFSVHFPTSIFPILDGGELAVLFCFIFLFLAAAGPGSWAIGKAKAR